jgi:cell division inhibitor SepF
MLDTIKSFFGVADKGQQPVRPVSNRAPQQRPAATARPVTPIRRTAQGQSEVFTLNPKSFAECGQIVDPLRGGASVVVNISEMSEAESKSMVHFMSGLVAGVGGQIKRVTAKVFLLTPEHVSTNDETEEEPEDEDDLLTSL